MTAKTANAATTLMTGAIRNTTLSARAGTMSSLSISLMGSARACNRPQGPTRIELAVGFSHTVTVEAPDGVTFEVPQPTRIRVLGIDKEAVGQVAANIRKIRKPEPYKGKGIRYEGEYVRRKVGKRA